VRDLFLVGVDDQELEYSLRGKAWRVYWLLLKHGHPMTARQVQRALHFSSPSIAQHHLERLRELSLVQKGDIGGEYSLVSQVKIGVLRHFIKLGRLLLPRYFFYAIFSTSLYIFYLTILMHSLTRESLFIAIFGLIVSAIFWFETSRAWRLKPF
jgi:hypothetical protein